MAGKNVRLPKGLVRGTAVHSSVYQQWRQDQYDKALEADFEAHRAEYITVEILGVPVKVKVEPKDESGPK